MPNETKIGPWTTAWAAQFSKSQSYGPKLFTDCRFSCFIIFYHQNAPTSLVYFSASDCVSSEYSNFAHNVSVWVCANI